MQTSDYAGFNEQRETGHQNCGRIKVSEAEYEK